MPITMGLQQGWLARSLTSRRVSRLRLSTYAENRVKLFQKQMAAVGPKGLISGNMSFHDQL